MQLTHVKINNSLPKTNKGFALAQILLAAALSSVICIGVVAYYMHTANTQQNSVIADQIVKSAEQSKQTATTGIASSNTSVVNGLNISSVNGTATVTDLTKTECQALSSSLTSRGEVTTSCANTDISQNKLVFSTNITTLPASSAIAMTAGTPDGGAVNLVDQPVLSGTTIVNTSGVTSGSASGSFTSTKTSGSTTGTLSPTGGSSGGTVVSSGSATSPSGISTPGNATGSSSADTCATSTTINWQVQVVGSSGPSSGSGVCSWSYQPVSGGGSSCPWTTVMSIPMNQNAGWPCPNGSVGCYSGCSGFLGTNSSRGTPPIP